MWSYSSGERPHTVTVYERESGGILYARAWDSVAQSWKRVSLKHRDKSAAKRYAKDQADKLERGAVGIIDEKVTLPTVFGLYQQHRTPRKALAQQKADARRIEMFTRFFGAIDPHLISLGQWEAFLDARSSGAIDARGKPVPKGERKAVRARGVEIDCIWLRSAFNWAWKWRLPSGQYIMRENPIRGIEFNPPKEKNPRRPVATQDRYKALQKITEGHSCELRNGSRKKRRSYLSEILDIVAGTGRRISAVCALRFDNLRLDRTKVAPYGAILWPADTDKGGRETWAPMAPSVRAAVDRIVQDRPGIGSLPLFPSPTDPAVPMTRHLADKWLREAERMAELEPQKGGLWHPYRRKWATERKHLPDVDVAEAGGWKSVQALKGSYQHADAETMLRVVLSEPELREQA
jgi:integrase